MNYCPIGLMKSFGPTTDFEVSFSQWEFHRYSISRCALRGHTLLLEYLQKLEEKTMSQFSLFFYQHFLSSITLEVKPTVMGQEDSKCWHFDNIFCRFNDHKKVIILEAIYQQSEKVQYQRGN